ncbi:uncharacterized protein [Aegilops tauschii subsp. strangulata]|uniref:uncharacterized protein n=1 Tax=Aegilops tauschii subsp. strangulata TaxID=200361 RepID=UPI000989E2C3|nr:uncharacterized protein LOC109777674 [Aegilops tauschii subsp. strangulata]
MAKHSVDFSFFRGPHNFSKWMDVHTSDACSSQARTNVEALVANFASGMSNLLGNPVQGWTAMMTGDGVEVANQFRNFVTGGTSRPIGSRGRYNYNDSQELPDSQEEFMNDAVDSDQDDSVRVNDGGTRDVRMDNVQSDPVLQSRRVDDVACVGKVSAPSSTGAPDTSKAFVGAPKRARASEDDACDVSGKRPKFDPVAARRSEATAGDRAAKDAKLEQPARSPTHLDKGTSTGGVSVREIAQTATRSSPRFASSNTGDPIVLVDRRKKCQAKKATAAAKSKVFAPPYRARTQLPVFENAVTDKASNMGAAPTSSAAPATFVPSSAPVLCTNGGAIAKGSDELISPRTANAVPALVPPRGSIEDEANKSSHVDAPAVQPVPHSNPLGANLSAKRSDRAHPSTEAGTPVIRVAVVQNTVPVVTHQPDQAGPRDASIVTNVVPKTTPNVAPRKFVQTVVCSRKSPWKISAGGIVHEQHAKDDGPMYVSASTLFPLVVHSNPAETVQTKGNADANVQQPSASRVAKVKHTPSLKHTRVPLDMGVPYTPTIEHPGKGSGSKVVINIADTTPYCPGRPKAAGADDTEMFVDLSPLAASVDVIDKQNVPTSRHPLAFTPPSCSLGLDLSQRNEAVDAVPVSYAFPAAPVPMMAQPNVGGKKAVKFPEPIVERSTDDISSPLHETDFNMDEDVDKWKKIRQKLPPALVQHKPSL